ncbi:hypothetical protein N9A70_05785, partial [Akkermansiaceae bacterium]|nr:hypothetical protein [Akkermansiaceae bacterium]MDB4383962.1 hypothetical protein [Akkermansiaceae bacterium]
HEDRRPQSKDQSSALDWNGNFAKSSSAHLGVTPGTSIWPPGSGPTADSLPLETTVIPEASPALRFGFGFLGFTARRKRR